MTEQRIEAVNNTASAHDYILEHSIGLVHLATGSHIKTIDAAAIFTNYNRDLNFAFKELVRLAEDMRAYQKNYFRSRRSEWLEKAKQAEEAFDKTLNAIKSPVYQTELFTDTIGRR